MADHGEAFGEHGRLRHATTLYDELLRVPLLVHVPGVTPQRVTAPVSLMDLGPTVLDLMGQSTPGHFLGQSLVPYLRGLEPVLSRPIVAEGRGKQALLLPDGRKVIVDNRSYTLELYDLGADPGEEHNLADDGAQIAEPLGLLRAFFEAHHSRRPGYAPHFRR
jgi:arylsulfatase A-like enzyme